MLLEEELGTYGKKSLVIKIFTWVEKTHRFNTHSLRYAFVSYLTKKGSHSIITKITGHRRLGLHPSLHSRKNGEKILREL